MFQGKIKQTVMKVYFSSPVFLLTRSVGVEERRCNIEEVKEKPYNPRSEVEISV